MMKLEDYISTEREFLHSISTPLMISMSQLDFVIAKKDKLSLEEIIDKIQKAKTAIDKVSSEVHLRRRHIKSLISE
ncbi:MAG: hypothetical protein KDD40_03635 [Bdellovibrionales bacterium]|nr:hypothetical protein [Bdellovibrionales bacterium]